MFTLRAGPSLKPFRVHKQLLGEISTELRGHVFNDMREGQEGSMDMAHVPEETMFQFLEFCYTGDYPELEEESESSEPMTSSSFQKLLPNANLYVLGDMYNITLLKDIAFDKLTAHIIEIGNRLEERKEIDAVIQLFEYAFENLPEREDQIDPLLEYLGRYAAWALDKFRESKDFISLFAGSNRADFVKLIFSNVPNSPTAPWEPRTNLSLPNLNGM